MNSGGYGGLDFGIQNILSNASANRTPHCPKRRGSSSQGCGGYVYLASSPAIGDDLFGAEVVVAVDVPIGSLPCAPLRENFGEPPRVELEFRAPLDEDDNVLKLSVFSADRLDRTVTIDDLDPPVKEAIRLFEGSPVGAQLADLRMASGHCQEASIRFLAALRETGSDGRLIAWGSPESTWWHCTVQLKDSDVIVDWTARQFDPDASFPRIEPRVVTEARWNLPGMLDIDSAIGRSIGRLPEVPPWTEAREILPLGQEGPEARGGAARRR